MSPEIIGPDDDEMMCLGGCLCEQFLCECVCGERESWPLGVGC